METFHPDPAVGGADHNGAVLIGAEHITAKVTNTLHDIGVRVSVGIVVAARDNGDLRGYKIQKRL